MVLMDNTFPVTAVFQPAITCAHCNSIEAAAEDEVAGAEDIEAMRVMQRTLEKTVTELGWTVRDEMAFCPDCKVKDPL
jgi:hypothetical protein